MWSSRTNWASVSNIGSSTSCAWPVRSRQSRAARMTCTAFTPTTRSAMFAGTYAGGLPGIRTSAPEPEQAGVHDARVRRTHVVVSEPQPSHGRGAHVVHEHVGL